MTIRKIEAYPNSSKGLSRQLKMMKSYEEIYIERDKEDAKKKIDFKREHLIIGYVERDSIIKKFKVGKRDALEVSSVNKINGSVRSKMFGSRNSFTGIYLVYRPSRILINVTEELLKKIQIVGSCCISESHCVYEEKSPMVKVCKFCSNKKRLKVKWTKKVVWE